MMTMWNLYRLRIVSAQIPLRRKAYENVEERVQISELMTHENMLFQPHGGNSRTSACNKPSDGSQLTDGECGDVLPDQAYRITQGAGKTEETM
jgi:hypothetical protein